MRVTVRDIQQMKGRGQRFATVTAYDYTSAQIADEAGIPLILVGDSLGQVVLGYNTTIPVTMEEMLHHCRAVARGAKRALLVGDMPFMTFQVDAAEALRNAGKFLQEGAVQAVKLEGGERVAETVHRLVECGIPVMGHIGLTPQSVHGLGGYRVQGRVKEEAVRLLRDAVALDEAGAFAIVLELVPDALAQAVTQRVKAPTIGIGAGPHCDGQVQVFHDLLGLFTDYVPRHTKQYLRLAELIRGAFIQYQEEVKAGAFPGEEHGSRMDEQVLQGVLAEVAL